MSAATALRLPEPDTVQVGDFVMLHPGSMQLIPPRSHPDAGRIGRVEAFDDHVLLVCFRDHPDRLSRLHCILPRSAWLPVDGSAIESREEAGGATSWHLLEGGE